jgi:integrase
VTRTEIIRLLDRIEDQNGPRMADVTLAILRKVMNWHAARSDDFRSPIVRGMSRQNQKENERSRILTDDELRGVWKAAESGKGPQHALVKFLLLTCARRGEAAELTAAELNGADWTLPARRNKAHFDLTRPLSEAALAVIESQARDEGGGPFVFSTTNGRRPFSDFSRFKAMFDLECGVSNWTLHDLRRSGRSLMSRAGVSADIAERCLGHVIGGVRGVYDRHRYHAEMLHAYEALAALIARIVDPPLGNVEQLRRA